MTDVLDMKINTPTATRPHPLHQVVSFLLVLLISSPLRATVAGIHHDMSVALDPARGEIQVSDRLSFRSPVSQLEFTLNAGLTPSVSGGDIEQSGRSRDGLRTSYRVSLGTPTDRLELHYHGQPKFSAQRTHGGMPRGLVSAQAVYLDGGSAWYPLFDAPITGFRLAVTLPPGWQSVSVGGRSELNDEVVWSSRTPHDDLYLIAGRFTRHAADHNGVVLSVYLLEDDPELAGRYLSVMGEYLDHYSRLIGAYPYAKFAVVENAWQTGFGMPSFTLLGSRVMRFPFILYTSLPHEILHNWWGNGVWVDYDAGNWSEGLTAYLADHWMQERRGKGDQYRLKALQRYSNFAAQGADKPLLEFVSRHNDASQSLGYSKSLMLFHMMRRSLGDQAFTAGLQRLWKQHAFTRIGFADTVRTLAGDSGALNAEFQAWLARSGAPHLTLAGSRAVREGDGWQLTVDIEQRQPEPFAFDLPIAVTLAGQPVADIHTARIRERKQQIRLDLAAKPLRVDVDPYYDVLRYLDATEQPPALNRLFGSRRTWLIMPTAAPPEMRAAWEALTDAWTQRYSGMSRIDDTDAADLDPGADRLLLGWDNALLPSAARLFVRDGQTLERNRLRLGERQYQQQTSSVVLVDTDPQGVTTGFIGAPAPQTVQELARKLPHYGSYGRLIFDRDGTNQRKDTLSSMHSQLSRQFSERHTPLQLPTRSPLGQAAMTHPR